MKTGSKTTIQNVKDIDRKWHVLSAEEATLGRLSTRAARLLMGKHKPSYTPHVDNGDYVVIINASKLKVTGAKMDQKKYYHYSGYPGGIKEITLGKLFSTRPEEVVRRSIVGMLQKNKTRENVVKRLKIYAGAEHPHEAQIGGKDVR